MTNMGWEGGTLELRRDSLRSISFLSFIEPISDWNVPFIPLIFLKRSLAFPVFPILLFSSISLHWSLRKAFLSLLDILWKSAFKWEYLSFPPLLFASLLFTALSKASSDNHFAFCISFPWGWSWSLSPVQWHEPPSYKVFFYKRINLNIFTSKQGWFVGRAISMCIVWYA